MISHKLRDTEHFLYVWMIPHFSLQVENQTENDQKSTSATKPRKRKAVETENAVSKQRKSLLYTCEWVFGLEKTKLESCF